jgi:hypothetical protein
MSQIPPCTALDAAQIQAYAEAHYEIELEGRWIDAAELAQNTVGALPLSLISACNPRSQRLADAANSARQQQLRAQIEDSGVRWWSARGRSSDFGWLEPGFLVEAELGLVDRWARTFDQHAVWLPARPDSPAIMRIYSNADGTLDNLDLPHVRLEWVGFGPTPAQ